MTAGWWVFDEAGKPVTGPWLCEVEAKYRAKRTEGSTYGEV